MVRFAEVMKAEGEMFQQSNVELDIPDMDSVDSYLLARLQNGEHIEHIENGRTYLQVGQVYSSEKDGVVRYFATWWD